MKKNALFWLLAVILSVTQVLAQNRTVSGVVTDAETGEPLIGVSVVVKGTTNGAVTDIDGKYKISNIGENDKILEFSYVGYSTLQEEITGPTLNLKMKSGVDLDEVVVVGYQSVKKSDVTSSISEVKGVALQNIPIGGVDNLLQGKAAGVQITAMNGRPGGNAYIRIRGTGSLNASSEPLILVDGVQIAARDYAMINPADIQDVTVLKDAAAAAIYGSRASNGVILVTTKRGTGASGGKNFNVQYSYNRGVKAKSKDNNFRLMNIREKIDYERELGRGNPEILDLDDSEIDNFIKTHETNWFDVMMRKARVESHDLSISGTSKDFDYYFSFGSYKEDGLSWNSNFDRVDVRFNADYRANKWLKIGNSISIVGAKDSEIRDRNNVQNPLEVPYIMNPYETVYLIDSLGNPLVDADGNKIFNPTNASLNGYENVLTAPNHAKYTNIIGNVYLQANLLDGLQLKTTVGLKHRQNSRKIYSYPGVGLDALIGNPAAPGRVSQSASTNVLFDWTNTATYNKTFKEKHNISLLAGTELLRTDFESLSASAIGFPNKDLMQLSVASTPQTAGGTREKYALFSIFGEAKYNYMGRYYLGASLRRDGSANFGPESRFGTFWGASAAWNIANESFLKNVKHIDQLKLRVSAGTSGNDQIGSFQYLSTYALGSYADLSSSFPTSPANPKLKWEKNFNYNVGIDFGFFQNRITGTVEYYNKKTNDLLFPVALSYTSGFTSQTQNIGAMRNQGVEAELRIDAVRKKDGFLTFYGNFSRNWNEVLSIPTTEEFLPTSGRGGGYTILKEGLEAYTFYVNRWAGVDASNGKALYYDKDGNVTDVYSDGDQVILKGKSPLPKWYGGFGVNAEYKGVFVDADFYYSGGNYTMNLMAQNLLSDGEGITDVQRADAADYWRNPGDITKNPNPAAVNFTSNNSDRFLQKADYLRLRSLRVGYNFPSSILKKVKLSNLAVYFQGTNLFTVTNYEGDPEVGIGTGENSDASTLINIPGEFSLFSYPQFRGFSFGVNVGF